MSPSSGSVAETVPIAVAATASSAYRERVGQRPELWGTVGQEGAIPAGDFRCVGARFG